MTPEKAKRWNRIWLCIALACAVMVGANVWWLHSEILDAWFWFTAVWVSLLQAARHEYWRRGYLAARTELAKPKAPRCTCTTFTASRVTINGQPTCRYCGLLP